MKTAKEWIQSIGTPPTVNGITFAHLRTVDEADIAAIQKDALDLHFAIANWEDDEFVVTCNGKPLGGTMHKHYAEERAAFLNVILKEYTKTP